MRAKTLKPDAIREAAERLHLTREEYLAYRREASPFHLRTLQKKEMAI